jgi:D-ribose pyranose/furanose isomerase RbsD
VVRLPELDEKEIRRIEQRLQMSQDGKADYNWVDELLTIHANIEEYGMTTLELAKDMNKKKPTVEKQLKMLTLIDMFLERTNKRGKYFEVESDEQAFKTLADGYSKYQGDSGKQRMLLDLAFPIILKNEPGESKHKRIAKITEYLSQIVAKIEADEAYVAEEVKEGNSASKDILDTVPSSNTFKPLSLKLTSDSSEIVHQAIRAVDRENDFQDMANGPAEAVTAAASLLKNIQVTSSMTKKKQFRGQLKAIQTTCELLIAEVDKLEKSNSIVD